MRSRVAERALTCGTLVANVAGYRHFENNYELRPDVVFVLEHLQRRHPRGTSPLLGLMSVFSRRQRRP